MAGGSSTKVDAIRRDSIEPALRNKDWAGAATAAANGLSGLGKGGIGGGSTGGNVTLGAATPVIFVSKAEVRRWPILGTLASCGGTLFLKRERKEDLKQVTQQFDPVVSTGIPLAIFLEGTSSGGDGVLPFRPSLLAPAVDAG